jgi:hypothetical protein
MDWTINVPDDEAPGTITIDEATRTITIDEAPRRHTTIPFSDEYYRGPCRKTRPRYRKRRASTAAHPCSLPARYMRFYRVRTYSPILLYAFRAPRVVDL